MGWKDLLQKENETVVHPWTGGRDIWTGSRAFLIEGRLPPEHGWYEFTVLVQKALRWSPAEAMSLDKIVTGFLVGDRMVPDGARVDPDPARVSDASERVHLIEPALDRFARVTAGRVHEGGPLI